VIVNHVVALSGSRVSPVPICRTEPDADDFLLLNSCCALVANEKREKDGMRVVCNREGEAVQ
jgi:hypothetical protein